MRFALCTVRHITSRNYHPIKAHPRGWLKMSDLEERRVLAQFKSEDGVLVGTPFDLPLDVTKGSLAALCNAVLENVSIYSMQTVEGAVRRMDAWSSQIVGVLREF